MLVVVDFTLNREVYVEGVEPGGVILCAVGADKESVESFLAGLPVEDEYFFDGVYDITKIEQKDFMVALGNYYLLKSEDVVLLSDEPYEGYRQISVAEFLSYLTPSCKYDFEPSLENTLLRPAKEGHAVVRYFLAGIVSLLLLIFVSTQIFSVIEKSHIAQMEKLNEEKARLEAEKKKLYDRYYASIQRTDMKVIEDFFLRTVGFAFIPDTYTMEASKSLRAQGKTYADALPLVFNQCRVGNYKCEVKFTGYSKGVMLYEVAINSR